MTTSSFPSCRVTNVQIQATFLKVCSMGLKGLRPAHNKNDLDVYLLLLASSFVSIGLLLTAHHFAQHDNAVAVHECDTRQALAVLKGVADQWLLWLEGALGHFIRLQRVTIFHFLSASFLPNFPHQLRNAAGGATTAHEANRRIPDLDLIRNVKDLNLGVELSGLPQRRVFLVHHDVARTRHVVLIQAFDVKAHIIARVGEVDALVVHLYGENLASARVRRSVRWQEYHLLTWLHHALLHTASKHVTDTLNLVDPRDRHPHRRANRTLWNTAHLVQNIVQGGDVE